MSLFEKAKKDIVEVSSELDEQIWAHINDLTKPPGALGELEQVAFRFARIRRETIPAVPKKRLYTFAGDHGVTEEGVSAFPAEVTVQMVANMMQGGAAINVFGRHVDCDVQVVDVGVNADLSAMEGVLHRKVRMGTRNMVTEAAMTEAEVMQALEVGIALALDAAADGVTLMGTGEMGIGNTTPAAALMHVLLPCDLKQIVGRGTGVDDVGLQRKRDAIAAAVRLHSLDGNDQDPLLALQKVGGLEIAALTGLMLGCAAKRIAVVVDGFISSAAALVACKLNPATSDYLLFSHLSAEQGHRRFVEGLGVRPILDLGFRLGEGTGAALAMSLVDASVKMMREMATFSSAGVSTALEESGEGAA
ncbi:MAG: nicotinate-nucleotide--dimethylbenzimidazole phosphoribosyltransferase [Deltaproteobacteria bacterium]|nr:nicotinate-nucleotide--dimethylbenzimidazole phosphoribosyltransferase [Deltaproteobacteria bacterium]